MKRLKRGEYQAMTEAEQFAHRKKCNEAWLSRNGNRKRMKARIKEYNHQYWLNMKDTYYERVCKKCGKKAFMKGKHTICEECSSIPTKTSIAEAKRMERRQARIERETQVLNLAKHTCLSQREIANIMGLYQEQISRILCRNGLRRQHLRNRGKNAK